MKRAFPLLGLLIVFLSPVLSRGQESTTTVRIYSNSDYRFGFEKVCPALIGNNDPVWDEKHYSFDQAGSAWALRLNGRSFLVTAAHVVGLATGCDLGVLAGAIKPAIAPCWVKTPKFAEWKTRFIIGTLSFQPKRIAWLSKAGDFTDIALIIPESDEVFSRMKLLTLAPQTPKEGERVTVIGYPHTGLQDLVEFPVSEVDIKNGHFTLGGAVDRGYSGGVVVDARGRAYGVVTSVDDKQTTVLLLDDAMLANPKWKNPEEMLDCYYEP